MTYYANKFREESEDANYYGIERQADTRAVMFEIRTKEGNRKAFPYSYLTEIDYIPETGIIIYVAEVNISIIGRNLGDVYNYLFSNRLTYIQEDFSGMDNEDSTLFIESISIKRKNAD